MSLARTALRLAAIEALRPTGSLPRPAAPAGGPWPTIARHRVYDAKIDAIDDLAVGARAPVISVYADEDESTTRQKGPPFERYVELSFELSIAQLMENPDKPDEYEPAIPVTDAESEASLDLLETSVRFALIYGPTGTLFRKASGNRVMSIISRPTRSGEEAIRLAMRTVTMRVQIDDDCFNLAPDGTEAGLDRLPQPIRGIVEALPDSAYGRAIAAGLSDYAPTAPVPTRPFTIEAGLDAHKPHDHDRDPDVIVEITPPQT